LLFYRWYNQHNNWKEGTLYINKKDIEKHTKALLPMSKQVHAYHLTLMIGKGTVSSVETKLRPVHVIRILTL